jgi:hypothetical protein
VSGSISVPIPDDRRFTGISSKRVAAMEILVDTPYVKSTGEGVSRVGDSRSRSSSVWPWHR